jgi:ketosteroid isomerase-like protein
MTMKRFSKQKLFAGPMTRAITLGCVLILPAWMKAADEHAPGKQSLEARVQHLEDLEEIRSALIDYGRFLDARDFASYSHLFAQEGEWVGGFGSVRGPAAIQAFMEKNMGPNKGNTLHVLTNFVIDVKGDTATAWSRWTFLAPGPDGKPVPDQAGHYNDMFVRENGHWKFQRRVAPRDIPVSSVPIPEK